MTEPFFEDYSDDSQGWGASAEEDAYQTQVQDGIYRLFVAQDWFVVRTPLPDRLASDVVVEVDARRVDGTLDNGVGVICRQRGVENQYYFYISSDGYFLISKEVDQEFETLVGWESHPAILGGEATDRIRAECVGDRLSLFANGVLLARVRDNQFDSGAVGVSVATFGAPSTEFELDDFFAAPADHPAANLTLEGQTAFVSLRDGNLEIYARSADGSEVNLTDHPALDDRPVFSPDGEQIAFESNRGGTFDVFVMNRDGTGLTRVTTDPADDGSPTWSPDGSRIAFESAREGNTDVYAINADGTGLARLTDHPARDGAPAWSPDGSQIAFSSERDGSAQIYLLEVDGSGLTRLTDHPGSNVVYGWSPDGSKILFSSDRTGNSEIYLIDVSTSEITRITEHPAHNSEPAFSPDGSKLLFTSDRDGNPQVYVVNLDGTGLVRVTEDGVANAFPSWGPAP